MPATIKINGLRELQGALKAAENATPKALRLGLNEAAQELLDYARPLVPKRSGRARASMKARSTQRAARVAAGGPKAPYYPWLDFGGRVGRDKTTVRQFYREGRYIYPSLRKHHEQIVDRIGESVLQVIREAGLDVT